MNTLFLTYGNQLEDAAEGPSKAGSKVEDTTNGRNASLDTQGKVDEAMDGKTGELEIVDPNSQGEVHGEDSHLHHRAHNQEFGHFLESNPIKFVKLEYKRDKHTSCLKLDSLPVFCSTTRDAVKVREIVTINEAATDTNNDLGSIWLRVLSGEPATRIVIYNQNINDISLVPGKLTKRRRDVKLDARGVLSAVAGLQGREGVQYGEGQLQRDKDYGEEEQVQVGFEGKHGLCEEDKLVRIAGF